MNAKLPLSPIAGFLALLVVGFAFFEVRSASAVPTQDPAPPLDTSPFERPRSICTLQGTTPEEVLLKLKGEAAAEQFTFEEFDSTNGYFSGTRYDRAPTGASSPTTDDRSDRILVWIERDLARPADRFKVFLMYARFQKVWGARLEMKRVQVSSSYEANRIGALRNRIVGLSGQ
jgi:hypothetical protein